MIDRNSLRHKYRELNSKYSDNLTKPVFKKKERSYQHHLRVDEPIDFANRQANPNIDLKHIDGSSDITIGAGLSNTETLAPSSICKTGRLEFVEETKSSHNREQVHQLSREAADNKPNVQSVQALTQRQDTIHRAQPAPGQTDSQCLPVVMSSQDNLIQKHESFGNLNTEPTNNQNPAQTPTNKTCSEMEQLSHHFMATSPLVLNSGDVRQTQQQQNNNTQNRLHQAQHSSQLQLQQRNLSSRPQRKDVFFRSGKEPNGLQKISLRECQSGDIPGVNDFIHGQSPPSQLYQINENTGAGGLISAQLRQHQQRQFTLRLNGQQQNQSDPASGGVVLGPNFQHENPVARRNSQYRKLQKNVHKMSMTSESASVQEYRSKRQIAEDNAKDGIKQGIRHAIALEKLIMSQDSTDSVLQDLREAGQSLNEKYESFQTIQNNSVSKTHRTGAGSMLHKRGHTISQLGQDNDYRDGSKLSLKESSMFTKPVVQVNFTQRKNTLQPIQHQKPRVLHESKSRKFDHNPCNDYPGLVQKILDRQKNNKTVITSNYPRKNDLEKVRIDSHSSLNATFNETYDFNIKSNFKQQGKKLNRGTSMQGCTFSSQTSKKFQETLYNQNYNSSYFGPSKNFKSILAPHNQLSQTMNSIPQHLNSTANSIRRQVKVSSLPKTQRHKNECEEQVKALIKKIKSKRSENFKKAEQNHKAREHLLQELRKQVMLKQEAVSNNFNESVRSSVEQKFYSEHGLKKVISQNINPLISDTAEVGERTLNAPMNFQQSAQYSLTNIPSKGINVMSSLDQSTNYGSLQPLQRTENDHQNRIHILYRGTYQMDVERQRRLTQHQVQWAKQQTSKHALGVEQLRRQNAEARDKIKLYIRMIEEQLKKIDEKKSKEMQNKDLNEESVTRKLGYTDIGDTSDIIEVGSVSNMSNENIQNHQSQALIAGRHSMIEIQKPGYSVNNSCETSPKNILERKKKILKKDEYTRSGEFLCDTPIKIRITSPDQKVPQNEEGNADIFFDTLNIPTAVSNEIEAASKIPVHKHPIQCNPDSEKIKQMFDRIFFSLRQERCIDVIVHFLTDLVKVFHLAKATIFAIEPLLKQTFRKGLTKDKAKYCNTVSFVDESTSQTSQIFGISPAGMGCQNIVFTSIKEIEAPGLMRAHKEDILRVSLQGHKIGVLIQSREGEPKLMLQVELNSARARKKPLNSADALVFQICLMVIYECLQKFKILHQAGSKRQGNSDIVQFCMRTSRYESHKELCRNLEQDLKQLENCLNVNVLFLERNSNQLYTIAFTEDDDYASTVQTLIDQGTQGLQKLLLYNRQNKKAIAQEKKRINEMQSEFDLDMNMRSLILKKNQMICIPTNQGLTGNAFGKAKTIYFNQYEEFFEPNFLQEYDNLKSLKNIKNFVFAPIVGHDGKPNGLLQLYGFQSPISRLQIKKMIALRKFLGGCLENINLKSHNLDAIVGGMNNIQHVGNAINAREDNQEKYARNISELQFNVSAVQKEISAWHNRATTEPGFMVPPGLSDQMQQDF